MRRTPWFLAGLVFAALPSVADEPFLPARPERSPEEIAAELERLVRLLEDGDWTARSRAEEDLLALGPEAAGVVLSRRGTVGPDVRAAFGRALERWGTEVRVRHIYVRDEAQARRLAERLAAGADFEYLARSYSEAPSADRGGDLGFLRPGRTVPAFEAAAFALTPGGTSPVVSTGAGYHIIQCLERRTVDLAAGDPAGGADRGRLLAAISALGAGSWEEREAATRILAAEGAPVADEIEALLESDDAEVRDRARRIWGELRWKLLIPEEVERALPGFRGRLQDPDPASRAAALSELATMPVRTERGLRRFLEETVLEETPAVAAIAARILAEVALEASLEVLAQRIDTPDAGLQLALAQALSSTGCRAAVSLLVRLQGASSPAARAAALEGLLALAASDSDAWLRTALADAADEVVGPAADHLLAREEPPGAAFVEPIAAALARAVPERRFLLVQVLCRVEDPEATDRLVRVLVDDSDRQIYRLAAERLLERPPQAVDPLSGLLGGADAAKAFYAVQILEASPEPEAVRALLAGLGSGVPEVRARAANAFLARARAADVPALLGVGAAGVLDRLDEDVRVEGCIIALGSDSEEIRRSALERLDSLGARGVASRDRAGWEAWWIERHRPDLLRALEDLAGANPSDRFRAARLLGQAPFERVREALRAQLELETVPWVRDEIARALGGE